MAQGHAVNNAVYLLPGRGHRLSALGDPVGRLGFDGYGRELAPPFARLGFADQIGLIQRDQDVGLPDGKGTVKSDPGSARVTTPGATGAQRHPRRRSLRVFPNRHLPSAPPAAPGTDRPTRDRRGHAFVGQTNVLVGLEPQRSLHLVRRIRHARRTVRPVEALMRQIRRDPRDPTTIPFDADPRDLDHARFEDRLSEPLGVPVTLE